MGTAPLRPPSRGASWELAWSSLSREAWGKLGRLQGPAPGGCLFLRRRSLKPRLSPACALVPSQAPQPRRARADPALRARAWTGRAPGRGARPRGFEWKGPVRRGRRRAAPEVRPPSRPRCPRHEVSEAGVASAPWMPRHGNAEVGDKHRGRGVWKWVAPAPRDTAQFGACPGRPLASGAGVPAALAPSAGPGGALHPRPAAPTLALERGAAAGNCVNLNECHTAL